MLGYGIGIPEWGSVYGPAHTWDEFKLTDMSCKGDEENLEDCLYRWSFVRLVPRMLLLPGCCLQILDSSRDHRENSV